MTNWCERMRDKTNKYNDNFHGTKVSIVHQKVIFETDRKKLKNSRILMLTLQNFDFVGGGIYHDFFGIFFLSVIFAEWILIFDSGLMYDFSNRVVTTFPILRHWIIIFRWNLAWTFSDSFLGDFITKSGFFFKVSKLEKLLPLCLKNHTLIQNQKLVFILQK